MRGLLGRHHLGEEEALLLTSGGAIHTCFMRFTIDVAFLNGEGRVLKIVHQLPPFRLCRSPRTRLAECKPRLVVELAAGRLAATGTQVGDRLIFKVTGEG